MAEVNDRVGRLEGIIEQINERLGSLDAGLREGVREIRDELRGLNAWLEAKASTWLVGAGIAWLSLLMTGLTPLTWR